MIYIDPATGAEQSINYKFDGTTAPGVNDDGATGHFAVGSEWFDISSTPKRRYSCVSNATGAAVWVDLTAIMPANEAGTAGQFLTAYNSTTGAWSKAKPDHGSIGGLTDDDHTQYALLAGRSGGQTLIGGTGTTDDLILQATSGVGASGSDIIFKVGNNGGTEAARFLYDGKFGIGTATPSQKFHIYNNSNATIQQLIDNTADGNYETQLDMYCKDSKWRIYNKSSTNSTNASRFGIYDIANSQTLIALHGGGAGTGYCQFAHGCIVGDLTSATIKQHNGLQLRYNSTSGSEYGILCSRDSMNMLANAYYDGSDYKYLGSDKAGRFTITDSGAFVFNNTNTTGSADGTITFLERLRILSTGEVGIGTTAPDRKLEINVGASTGGIRITYNDANGTATYYVDLLVDSSGNLTVTPSGGTSTIGGKIILSGLRDDEDAGGTPSLQFPVYYNSLSDELYYVD